MGLITSKKALFSELELKTERVPLGAGEVIITELAAEEFIDLWNSPEIRDGDKVNDFKFNTLLLGRCVVDAAGKRLLDDKDVVRLQRASRAPMLRLVAAVKRLNGFTEEAELKNSGETA